MAQQPIYVEADEEMPEVVERLRAAPTAEVAIVLPNRSRLGQSRFNFQLLREYAGRMGKTVAIISPETAVQALASEHGFSSFPSVDSYLPGAGAYAPAPQPSFTPAPATSSPVAVAAPPAAAAVAPPAPRTVTPPPRPAAAHKPSPLEGFRDREIFGGGPNRSLLYGGAALVLLVGLAAMVLFVPSATVTLTAQAQAFSQPLDINAQPGSGPVAVRVADDSQQASQPFKTTGEKVTPAQPATGTVTYTNSCNGPFGGDLNIPDGQRLDGAGQQFAQQGAVVVPQGSTANANVIATQPGTAGNVPANSITTIEPDQGQSPPSCLTVNNANPTTGGAAQKQDPMLSQQDFDNARNTLTTNLKNKIQSDLGSQAKSGEKLDSTINYDTPAYLADHKVGDLVSSFTGSMTLKGSGTFYSDGDVRNQLTQNLTTHVPAADTTTDNKIQTDYQVTSSQPGGHLTFHGTASGYIAPRLDLEQISSQLSGKSYSAAVDFLRTLPVRGSTIDQSPFPLPTLPLMTSRIVIHYRVETGTPAST